MDFTCEIIQRDAFVIEHGSHVRDAIMVVLEGEFTCTVHGITHRVGKGDVFAFAKNTLFFRKVTQPITCVYLQFAEFPIPLYSGHVPSEDPQRLENTVSHLARAAADKNTKLCEHFLWDILLLHRKQGYVPDPTDPMVLACLTYFNRHMEVHTDLETLSKHFSISKQGLIRKFKKSTGKTPMEYLAFTRINQGKLLLRESALSVGEIAAKCGFENVYYFSNCFKKLTGCSPSDYRKSTAQ